MCETKVVVCVKFKGNAIQAAADATRCDSQSAVVTWGVDQASTAVMAYDEKEKKFYFFRPSGEQLKITVEVVGNDSLAVYHKFGPTWNQAINLPKWSLR